MYTRAVITATFLELSRLARVEIILDKTEQMLRGLDLPDWHPLWMEQLHQMEKLQDEFCRWADSVALHDATLAADIKPPQEDSRESKQSG